MIHLSEILDPATLSWVLPLIIFFARVTDVSLGTIRIIAISRGKKGLAAIMGFFEVFVWILVISQILAGLSGLLNFASYAAGYAAGNYVGLILEQQLSMGVVVVRVFTRKPPSKRKKKKKNDEPPPDAADLLTAPVSPAPAVQESMSSTVSSVPSVPVPLPRQIVSGREPPPVPEKPVYPDESISKALRNRGYGVTRLNARGEFGPVTILYSVVKRRNLNEVLGIIKQEDPVAFYTVEDIRAVDNEATRFGNQTRPRKIHWRFLRGK